MNPEKVARRRANDRELLNTMLARHGTSEVLRMLAAEVLDRNLDGYPESARLARCLSALADEHLTAPFPRSEGPCPRKPSTSTASPAG